MTAAAQLVKVFGTFFACSYFSFLFFTSSCCYINFVVSWQQPVIDTIATQFHILLTTQKHAKFVLYGVLSLTCVFRALVSICKIQTNQLSSKTLNNIFCTWQE